MVDLRSAEDYAAGHIEGAINLPYGKGMQENFSILPTDKTLILQCYSGQTASQTMAGLRVMGYLLTTFPAAWVPRVVPAGLVPAMTLVK